MAMAVLLAVLLGARALGGSGGTAEPGASSSPSPLPPAAYLYGKPAAAPALTGLLDQDGKPWDPVALSGGPTLVFFGYTHCPDVCPATTGTITTVMAAYGTSLRSVFVSVDPERDTVAWLQGYVKYLPAGFTALTGTAADVKAVADLWGVRYARVESGTPGEYSMSHTAEVYLVDGSGVLRAHFPFGTPAEAMLATLRLVAEIGRAHV